MNIIGVDIGGTKCAVIRADRHGIPRDVRQFPTTGVRETLKKLYATIQEMDTGGHPVFGISCGGPLDTHKGVILSPPNLPGWDGIAIVKQLERRFGGEAYLMNDANAGALAEWAYGAAKGCKNVVFLTFGTGMGAGIILDNRLYEGTSGYAGEVGHVRLAADGPVGYGKAGSFEGFCSGGGIARMAQERAKALGVWASLKPESIEDITARKVAEAAEQGDAQALELLATVGRYLGLGLSLLIDVLNPQIIVIGSVYVRCQRFLEPTMRQALQEEALAQPLRDCRIVPAALGDEIGSYAAVAVARYRKGLGP
ncbi:MAG: sugar kinase [Chloroflexi bacterium RBG_16_68_14]|nr:MAG: sugar kinase [Chloroflexi bacterium RBG_16_68_14]